MHARSTSTWVLVWRIPLSFDVSCPKNTGQCRSLKKCPTRQTTFSRQAIETFKQNIRAYRGKFFNSPWKFHRHIFIASKITAFAIPRTFQNYTEKWTATCNVQCSPLLDSLFQSTFEMSTLAFTQVWRPLVNLSVAFLIEPANLIITVTLSSVR